MRIETNSRLSFLFTFLSITLISVQSSFVGAVAEFRDGTLILPYVLVGDELYSVELVLADWVVQTNSPGFANIVNVKFSVLRGRTEAFSR